MSEAENTTQYSSDADNSPFKAIVPNETLPSKMREEVVGTMDILTLFGNIIQLFTSNFGSAVISMLGDTNSKDAENTDDLLVLNHKKKHSLPSNDNNTSSLI